MATVLDKPRIVSSARELAIALSKSLRQVQRYLSDGMPGSQGCYDIEDCKEWIARNVKSQDAESGDLKEARLRAEVRKLNAEAEAKEMKNEQLAGELCLIADVQQEVSACFLRIKTRLEAIPNELEMLFPAELRASLKGELAERVRLILVEMAAWKLEVEGDGVQSTD